MKVFNQLLLLGGIFMFAACSASQTAIQNDVKEVFIEPERPVPNPVEEPASVLRAIERGTRTFEGKPGVNYWTNYTDYELNALLSPQDTMLYGNATITYTNNSPDTLRFILLELAQNVHKEGMPRKEQVEITGGVSLDKVSAEGMELKVVNRMQPGYVVDGTNMIVILPSPLMPGESSVMEIDWNFKIPQSGASGRMGYSRDNLFYIGYWYPHVRTYDDVEGWFGDPFVAGAEFYHGFGDYDLTITAPEEWLVMGTGEFLNPEEALEDEIAARYMKAGNTDEVVTVVSENDFGNVTRSTEDGTMTWRFRAENVRDVAFSATKESQWDASRTPVGDLNNDGQMDYSRINAFWRDSAPLWKDGARYTQHAIKALSEYTDFSYPWPHMTSVEGAGIIGGGMEFPMMTVIGGYNGRPTQALYDVIAHELAHMWIPMIVSNNERRRAWMDEGSTTFHEAQARKDIFPENFNRLNEFAGYLQIAGSEFEGEIMRRSDYHYPGPAYGVASYPKPATILFALEGVLGEETFYEAWTEYIDRWAYKHPTPYDMFNTFEDVSGKDLNWFWRTWYFETWVLDQTIADVVQGENSAVITIMDIGDAPMPVLLRITFEDGTTEDRRIEVTDWLRGLRETSIEIESSSPVQRVEIDPDNYFPDVNRTNNVWEALN
ncbi:M1 family metallopeptidase [Balneola sp. MJW-20]|uniref:M1 family metallopeptidase n=1 Tax=Gracilimonas aurantiaca TaxID=3234185 RepID=UPI0034673D1A